MTRQPSYEVRREDVREGGRSLNPLSAVAALVGLALLLFASYVVVRGPFMGGPLADPTTVIAGFGGFIVGLVVLVWGAVGLIRG